MLMPYEIPWIPPELINLVKAIKERMAPFLKDPILFRFCSLFIMMFFIYILFIYVTQLELSQALVGALLGVSAIIAAARRYID